jgi:quercetin dioxygenase-like cupin family protein
MLARGFALGLLGTALLAAPAGAAVTVKDPPGPVPDATHIPFTLPKDIQWHGDPARSMSASLYGSPSKPGPYAVLIKWMPGAFSKPHFHDRVRHIYVVSGTWWVSSSTTYDENLTYPMHAGTVVTDVAGTVHWDGARSGEKEPAVILLAGIGPVKTVMVDQSGKPLPGQ